jgi:hypothetical protein
MVSHRLFFISLILFCFTGYSQESQIKHYQRKCELPSLLLPCSNYNSKSYSISFPDSLYTSGKIDIKKLAIGEYKTGAEFYFSKNKYTKIVYIIKKSKLKTFKLHLNDSQYEITEEKLKGKVKLTLTCKYL